MEQSDPGKSMIQELVDSLTEGEGVDLKHLLFKWGVLEGNK